MIFTYISKRTDTTMKINLQRLIIILCTLLCAVYQAQGMEQIKTNIKNILNSNIKITINHLEESTNTTTLVCLYDDKKNLLANSAYTISSSNSYINLDRFFVNERLRNQGLGEQFFYLTMYKIQEEYSHIPDVEWNAVSLTQNDDLLSKFYHRVGATKKLKRNNANDFFINLKDAGYFDEVI